MGFWKTTGYLFCSFGLVLYFIGPGAFILGVALWLMYSIGVALETVALDCTVANAYIVFNNSHRPCVELLVELADANFLNGIYREGGKVWKSYYSLQEAEIARDQWRERIGEQITVYFNPETGSLKLNF